MTRRAKSESNRRYSINLSARTNSVSGTVTPIALAVLRLITSSNLVGCSTGTSATFGGNRHRFALSIGRLRRQVGEVEYRFGFHNAAHISVRCGPKWRTPERFGVSRGHVVGSNKVQALAVPSVNSAHACLADARGVLEHRSKKSYAVLANCSSELVVKRKKVVKWPKE